jgi:two-component system, NtrC family, response regulator HydG
VREMQNVVKRLMVMAEDDIIDVPDLPSLMRFSIPRKPDFTRTLAEVEADYIQHVLDSVGGNKSKAAEVLGIARGTLREKLKKVGQSSD